MLLRMYNDMMTPELHNHVKIIAFRSQDVRLCILMLSLFLLSYILFKLGFDFSLNKRVFSYFCVNSKFDL